MSFFSFSYFTRTLLVYPSFLNKPFAIRSEFPNQQIEKIDPISSHLTMIDFTNISTLLFDLDNTLIMFDERAFIPIYGRHVHAYFNEEIPSYEKFMKLFLQSTHMMLQKGPEGFTNNEKFAANFAPKVNLSNEEILKRFFHFYENGFDALKDIISPAPKAQELIRFASKHFNIVAATNPLFPAIATEKRLLWGGIGSVDIPWLEVTSADNYSTAKPYLEYYKELLTNINKTPSECLMIGNDKVNDMVAGQLGIKTFLIESDNDESAKIIKTDLDDKENDFPIDDSGTLEEFNQKLRDFIADKGSD
ncbi:MAG: HAD family hydrolase [Candidatus Hodarchaeales archaeon]|jgi:FMN phosphatase YigB (HAD superfamily)